MIVFFTFFIMFISSTTIILHVNHLASSSKKEMKRLANQQKFRKPLQKVKVADNRVLIEV